MPPLLRRLRTSQWPSLVPDSMFKVCRRVEQLNIGKSIYMGGLLARKGSTPEIRQILNVREDDLSGLESGESISQYRRIDACTAKGVTFS